MNYITGVNYAGVLLSIGLFVYATKIPYLPDTCPKTSDANDLLSV